MKIHHQGAKDTKIHQEKRFECLQFLNRGTHAISLFAFICGLGAG